MQNLLFPANMPSSGNLPNKDPPGSTRQPACPPVTPGCSGGPAGPARRPVRPLPQLPANGLRGVGPTTPQQTRVNLSLSHTVLGVLMVTDHDAVEEEGVGGGKLSTHCFTAGFCHSLSEGRGG